MYSLCEQAPPAQTFSNHSTQPSIQILEWKVHKFVVKLQIWGWEFRWGKLVTMEPEMYSPACSWYMRWRRHHYRREKKPWQLSCLMYRFVYVYDKVVTEMKASINISSITCWAFGGILPYYNVRSTPKWWWKWTSHTEK